MARGIRRSNLRVVKANKPVMKGARVMESAIQNQPLNLMSKISGIARKAIKEKGLTEKEVRKTLGVKRYEEE